MKRNQTLFLQRPSKWFFSGLYILLTVILIAPVQASGGGILRGVLPNDPTNLDAAHLFYTQDQDIAENTYQGIVEFDLAQKPPFPIVPMLAEKYEVSDDAKTITFHLRKNVQFHRGYGEMTSEDVVFTLKRHMDPKTASRVRSQLEDIERIEAPDKYTVVIYLKSSSAFTLLQNLAYHAGYVMSKKAVEKLGDEIEMTPIGTGPYYFEEWNPGEKVVFKKFDKYWGTPGKLDGIEFWIIPDETVALGALEKGELDIVDISQLGSPERAKTIKGIKILQGYGSNTNFIEYINHKQKPMDDIRVRRALAYALDIKGISERLSPLVRPFPSPFAPAVFSATDEFWNYEFDLEKAKKLLTEAGYPNGFELRIIYNKRGLYEPMVLELKRCWDKIVDVKLQLIERAVFVKTLKEYNQHIAAWVKGRPAPYLFAQCYETGSPANYSQYSNPEVDALIQKAISSTTKEDALKYWREFQKKVTEDVVNIWPATVVPLLAVRDGVKGVVPKDSSGMPELKNAYFEK